MKNFFNIRLKYHITILFSHTVSQALVQFTPDSFLPSTRYMAIMNPLKPRMGKRATLCIAAAIWIVGIIISSPMLLFFTTFELQDRVVCYSEWPDGPSNHSMQEYV